jgi:hypothetical protein
MGSAAALVVMWMAAGQAEAPPPSTAADLPVSIERVREGLSRPTLKIPPIEVTPVFRTTVVEDTFDNPLQGARRELAASSGYSPRGGVDVLGLAMGIVKSLKGKYRAHSEARIRKEVEEELTVFCAEHDCSVLEDGPPPMEGILLPRRARSN